MLGAGFSYMALVNHFVALVVDVGFTAMFAANLLLIYAVIIMLGRGCGFISDAIGVEMAFTVSMIMMLFSLLMLFFVKDTSSPWMLYGFIALSAFGGGMYIPAYGAAAADLFQGKNFGSIIGFANMGFGIGAGIGTWLYGLIFDITGNYSLAIIITMIAVCVMGAAIWVAAPRKVRRIGRASRV